MAGDLRDAAGFDGDQDDIGLFQTGGVFGQGDSVGFDLPRHSVHVRQGQTVRPDLRCDPRADQQGNVPPRRRQQPPGETPDGARPGHHDPGRLGVGRRVIGQGNTA